MSGRASFEAELDEEKYAKENDMKEQQQKTNDLLAEIVNMMRGGNGAGQGGSLGESLETASSGTGHSGFLRFENFVAKISDELSKHRPCQSL